MGKASLDKKFRLCGRAVGPDTIFHGDPACFVLAKRRVNHSLLRRDMTVDDGKIFLLDSAAFENFAQFPGSFGIFGDENDTTGFAVEAVDQMRLMVES